MKVSAAKSFIESLSNRNLNCQKSFTLQRSHYLSSKLKNKSYIFDSSDIAEFRLSSDGMQNVYDVS